jgi:hypothetical protein
MHKPSILSKTRLACPPFPPRSQPGSALTIDTTPEPPILQSQSEMPQFSYLPSARLSLRIILQYQGLTSCVDFLSYRIFSVLVGIRAFESGPPHPRTVITSHIHHDFLSLVNFGQYGSFLTPHGELEDEARRLAEVWMSGSFVLPCDFLYFILLLSPASFYLSSYSLFFTSQEQLPQHQLSNLKRAASKSNNSQWPNPKSDHNQPLADRPHRSLQFHSLVRETPLRQIYRLRPSTRSHSHREHRICVCA